MHPLPLDTLNDDIYLNLSFSMYAELMPLILKITFFVIFQDFQNLFSYYLE